MTGREGWREKRKALTAKSARDSQRAQDATRRKSAENRKSAGNWGYKSGADDALAAVGFGAGVGDVVALAIEGDDEHGG